MKKRNHHPQNPNNRSLVDLISFKNKVELPSSKGSIIYINQYNDFWSWKISVEQHNRGHILDTVHLDDTCKKLLGILPRWQTYRGIKCNYGKRLPKALAGISDAYNEIRQHSLLEFHLIPDATLRFIWEVLGRVKEEFGDTQANQDYFIIAVCKPLMFLWGQTLAFDSINRINIRKDVSLKLTNRLHSGSRWTYSQWKCAMQDFQKELLQNPEIISHCQSHSRQAFGCDSIVPYGRYLDLYYYY